MRDQPLVVALVPADDQPGPFVQAEVASDLQSLDQPDILQSFVGIQVAKSGGEVRLGEQASAGRLRVIADAIAFGQFELRLAAAAFEREQPVAVHPSERFRACFGQQPGA